MTTGVCDPSGKCLGAAPVSCDDGNACTTDVCLPGASDWWWFCQETGVCTIDGDCIHLSYMACDDGIPCTADFCGEAGECRHDPIHSACSDGIDCTEDLCDPVTGCDWAVSPVGAPCDDSNACTNGEACQPSPASPAGVECTGGVYTDCDDGDPCTADYCEEAAWGDSSAPPSP